jgi:hypothetical protein
MGGPPKVLMVHFDSVLMAMTLRGNSSLRSGRLKFAPVVCRDAAPNQMVGGRSTKEEIPDWCRASDIPSWFWLWSVWILGVV